MEGSAIKTSDIAMAAPVLEGEDSSLDAVTEVASVIADGSAVPGKGRRSATAHGDATPRIKVPVPAAAINDTIKIPSHGA
ncbi:MAG: hypothetical protein FJX76_06510 [Armatimonadetes bacterium]|nr:hypothetical protein [Armatimonadota bacterium]